MCMRLYTEVLGLRKAFHKFSHGAELLHESFAMYQQMALPPTNMSALPQLSPSPSSGQPGRTAWSLSSIYGPMGLFLSSVHRMGAACTYDCEHGLAVCRHLHPPFRLYYEPFQTVQPELIGICEICSSFCH